MSAEELEQILERTLVLDSDIHSWDFLTSCKGETHPKKFLQQVKKNDNFLFRESYITFV